MFIVLEQVCILKNDRVNQLSKGTLINDDLIDILNQRKWTVT